MGQQFSGQIRPEILNNRKISNYHPKQIQYLTEKFVLMCDDDLTIGVDTFSKLLGMDNAEGERIFEYFDMDNSGKIDSYEFICGMALLSHATLSQKAEIVFHLYDFDNSLVLNFDEMVVLIRCCLCSLAAMCGRRDVPSIQDVEEKVDKLFNKYDLNSDGQMCLSEFQSIVTKEKMILQTLKDYGLIKSYDLRSNFGGESADLPECDSDLENEEFKGMESLEVKDSRYDQAEINGYKISKSTELDRMKQGIDFSVVKQDQTLFEYDSSLAEKSETNAQKTKLLQWRKQVAKSQSDQTDNVDSSIPGMYLELEYVYGYRCHDTRNNIAYSPSGDLIYHTAALGVVLNKKTNTQKFFTDHYDDVTCLVSFDTLIATGQVGKRPLISIWDSKTQALKGAINSPLRKGISHMDFSQDGKKLAAMSIDEFHSVAIFDVAKVLASKGDVNLSDCLLVWNVGPPSSVFHMCFDGSNNRLAFACKNGIWFGQIGSKQLEIKEGQKWSPACPKQSVLCLISMDYEVVAGTISGKLVIFKDEDLVSEKPAHKSAITAIHKRTNNRGFITGGNDAIIIIWDGNYNIVQQINLIKQLESSKISSMNPKIRAIAEDSNQNITIGTRGGELLDLKKDGSFTLLNRGHFKGELKGLCQLNKREEFVSVGEDGLLAIIDLQKKRIVNTNKLIFTPSCVDCDLLGKRLAVGCANGYVIILDVSTFQIIKTIKDRDQKVTCVKYSPDGEWLSVGSEDTEVLNYQTSQNYMLKSRMRAHQNPVAQIDFSSNSLIIQTVCVLNQMIYSNLETGKIVKNGAVALSKEEWKTWSSPVGFQVNGIWANNSTGCDIRSVSRSYDEKLLAIGDDYGMIKIFNYPVTQEKSGFSKFIGHSSAVSNVLFSQRGDYLISTGLVDKSVMQWKVNTLSEQGYDFIGKEEETLGKNLDEEDILYQPLKQFRDTKAENPQGIRLKSQKTNLALQDSVLNLKPYIGEIRSSVPANFVPSANCYEEPNQNIDVQHIFGVRSVGVKNLVKYSANDKVVFACTKFGVVMDPSSRAQSFFSQHTFDVVSLAIHPKKKIAATGQMTKIGMSKMVSIYIWDIETREVIAHLQDYHRYGVNVLKFSPDGSKLLTIGKDENNSLAIYDWANERLIVQEQIDKYLVTDAAWKNENEFVTIGKAHIKFFENRGTNMQFRKGRWGSHPSEPLISAVFCFPQNICFTGGKSGRIYTWQSGSCTQIISAHTDSLRVLIEHKHMLYSAGDDGIIKMWSFSGKLQKQGEDLAKIANHSKHNPAIRSLDIKKDGTLLVATKGGEIMELLIEDEIKTNIILQGFGEGTILATATHPMTSRFVASGDDMTLRIYDASNKMMIAMKQLDYQITALDWSGDGQFIIAASAKGVIVMMDINLQELHKLNSTFNDKSNRIRVLKISPDNTLIAFGAEGSIDIEVHSIFNNKLISKGLIRGLTGSLTHLDWGVESNIIQTNSEAYELKFFSLSHMKQIKSVSAKDQKFLTISCRHGWSVQGISSDQNQETVTICSRAKNQRVLAVGEKSGVVKLFKYPSTQLNSNFKSYEAHTSDIIGLSFMVNDTYILTHSVSDQALIVWKTDFGNFEGLEEDEVVAIDFDNIDISDISSVNPEIKHEKLTKALKIFEQGKEIGANKGENQLFENEEIITGDQFMAIKPWQATIKPPRKFIKPQVCYDQIPNINLELYHVFGYKAADLRNNIRILHNPLTTKTSVVYFTACVAINHSLDTHKQKYFQKHLAEITAIDYSASNKIMATGDRSKFPKIHIWDSEAMLPLGSFSGLMTDGIRVLRFSSDGTKLLAVTCDSLNSIYVYSLVNNSLISKARGFSKTILDAVWVSEFQFYTVGIDTFRRWDLKDGRLKSKRGIFGKMTRILTCVKKNLDHVIAGTISGSLQIWKGNKVEKELPLLEHCIDCLAINDTNIFVAGKDGSIHILNTNYVEILKVETSKLIEESLNHRIRSIDCTSDSRNIVIGTQGSEIFRLKTNDAKINKLTRFNYDVVTQGHSSTSVKNIDEVWGLATFSDGDRFVTVSDDSTLRVWSTASKSLVKMISLNVAEDGEQLDLDPHTLELSDGARLRSVTISPQDLFITVGAKDGTLRILSSKDYSIVKHIKERNKWISDIKFSPNNLLMAVGSHDGYIDIYMVPEFRRKYALRKHSSFITHMDWSIDSCYLQSNCGGYELLYWDMTQGKQLTQGANQLRDETWDEISCVFNWSTQGIWEDGLDGTDINMVSRSTTKLFGEYNILAVCDDKKTVKVYKYPCLKKGAGCVIGSGHSNFVTNVRFSRGDEYLYSTGGRDGSVFVWKVTKRS